MPDDLPPPSDSAKLLEDIARLFQESNRLREEAAKNDKEALRLITEASKAREGRLKPSPPSGSAPA